MRPIRPSLARPPGDPFVGRQDELARLKALFRGGARLVTITGPGGIGKTRLAIELAAAWAAAGDAPTDGVWFCDLVAARTSDDLVAAVDAALDAPIGELRRPFLVLDNFEQLVRWAPTVGEWLAAHDEWRLLVTSREALGIRAEVRFPLAPLGLDASIELIELRARARYPEIELGEAERPALSELVARLDRVPLAIELAAARMGVFSPGELLRGLRPLDLLRNHDRDGEPRHETLRATIDWSWNLLSPSEQLALAQCSVFRGGFTIDAATAVCRIEATESIVDVLQSLVDKSLLHPGSDPVTGRRRLSSYETVREYAEERLEALGARADAERRHKEHFLAACRAWTRDVYGSEGVAALEQIRNDRENLIAVYERSVEDDPDAAVLVLSSLSPQPVLTGGRVAFHDAHQIGSLLARIERALEVARASAVSDEVRARISWTHGVALSARGRWAEAEEELLRALALARGARLGLAEFKALSSLAETRRNQRDLRGALAHVESALATSRAAENPFLESFALGFRGMIEWELGDDDAAQATLEQALALHRRLRLGPATVMILGQLGALALARGDLDRARDCFAEGAAVAEDPRRRAISNAGVATALWLAGAYDRAAEEAERARRVLGKEDDPWQFIIAFGIAAACEVGLGRDREGEELMIAAREQSERGGGPFLRAACAVIESMTQLGSARRAIAASDGERARRHLEAAQDGVLRAARVVAGGPLLSAPTTIGSPYLRLCQAVLQREMIAVKRDVDRLLGPAEASGLPAPPELSRRERQVLACLVEGCSYKQVAAELDLSIDTVRTYVRQLYRKLDVHNVAEAVSLALRRNLLEA